MQMNGKRVIEYPRVVGSIAEMKAQFKEQLEDFSKKAASGEMICLSDLISNAEKIHIAAVERRQLTSEEIREILRMHKEGRVLGYIANYFSINQAQVVEILEGDL